MTTSLGASALADEFTALSHAHAVRQVRVKVLAALAGVVVYVATLRLGLWGAGWGLSVLTVGVFAGLVLLLLLYPAVSVPITWRPATRRLLAGQPWRETAVRVLNVGGTRLYLTGGEYIKVMALPPAVREMIVRAGRVWLVGPDARGRLAVRVDGLLTAWPARRIRPFPATAALPTGEPITRILLHPLTDSRQSAANAAVAGSAILQIVGSMVPPANWYWFAGAVVMLGCAVVSFLLRRRLRRLFATPPVPASWVRAGATVSSWRVRWNGMAAGTVALTLPDGRACTAHVRWAPLDLFADVHREKALWIAGDRAVGFPYYGIVAVADLTPAA